MTEMLLLFSVVPAVLSFECYLGLPGENLPRVGCRPAVSTNFLSSILGVLNLIVSDRLVMNAVTIRCFGVEGGGGYCRRTGY